MDLAHRYHDISCGHRVYKHESKCAHLHGHNYRVHFTCAAAELDSVGRVLDFSSIKERLCMWLEREWDHKFLIWQDDPWLPTLMEMDPQGVVPVPFNPTAENMAGFLVGVLGPMALHDTGVVLIEVRVEETIKCHASHITSFDDAVALTDSYREFQVKHRQEVRDATGQPGPEDAPGT